MTASGVAECSAQFSDFEATIGAEAYERFLGCGIEAQSCMEMVGCMSGAVAKLGGQAPGSSSK